MAQSLANVLLHLVWSTKHREPWILDQVRPRFHGYLVGVLDHLDCPSLETNSEPDHVHVLCRLSRTQTIANLIEKAKTSTSAWMKSVEGVNEHFCWQGGYSAFSVSESQVETVRHYIQNQNEHHRGARKLGFQDELRALLLKNGLAFDERYLWE